MKAFLILALVAGTAGCVTGSGVGPDIAGRILRGDDYELLRGAELDRTDSHTGSVVVTGEATSYYYLVPDGRYWRISDVWPPDPGACTFDVNVDTWDLIRDGGGYAHDANAEAWTDGANYYRLGGEGLGKLVLVLAH